MKGTFVWLYFNYVIICARTYVIHKCRGKKYPFVDLHLKMPKMCIVTNVLFGGKKLSITVCKSILVLQIVVSL